MLREEISAAHGYERRVMKFVKIEDDDRREDSS